MDVSFESATFVREFVSTFSVVQFRSGTHRKIVGPGRASSPISQRPAVTDLSG